MNLRENKFDIAVGLTSGFSAIEPILLASVICEQGGADFSRTATALILSVAVGTFAVGLWGRCSLILAPSVPLAAFMTYETVLSRGLPWQKFTSALFIAGLLGLVALKFFPRSLTFLKFPPPLKWSLPIGVGFALIVEGMVQGRLALGAPLTIFMLGSLADPTAFYTSLGLILTSGLLIMGCRTALLIGMVAVAVLSFVEGFWIVPDAPFNLSTDLLRLVCCPDFSVTEELGEWIGLVLLLLLLFMTETQAMLEIWRKVTSDTSPSEEQRILACVLGANCLSAWLGGCGLRLAPESFVGATVCKPGYKAAYVTALTILPLIFLLPLAKEMVSFTAIFAPALIVTGTWLMGRGYAAVKDKNFTSGEAAAALTLILILGLTRDFLSGIGLALILYIFLEVMEGKRYRITISEIIWAFLFALYFMIYG